MEKEANEAMVKYEEERKKKRAEEMKRIFQKHKSSSQAKLQVAHYPSQLSQIPGRGYRRGMTTMELKNQLAANRFPTEYKRCGNNSQFAYPSMSSLNPNQGYGTKY